MSDGSRTALYRAWLPYLAWMGGLVTLYYLVSGLRPVVWPAMGLSGAAAVLVGVGRHHPRNRLPWQLIAAGLLMSCAGGAIQASQDTLGRRAWSPTLAETVYLIMVPALVAGLVLLTRRGVSAGTEVLDGLVIALALGVVTWALFAAPGASTVDLTTTQRLTVLGYVVGAALVALTATRVLGTARHNRSVLLLTVGAVGLLTAGVWYAASRLGTGGQAADIADLGWFVLYGAWGAAALDPSMSGLVQPRTDTSIRSGLLRLVLLIAAALVTPVVLLAESLSGPVNDGEVLAVVSATVFIAVLLRLSSAAVTHRRTLARERALRASAAALVGASDDEQVFDAMRAALPVLLPAGADFWVRTVGVTPPGAGRQLAGYDRADVRRVDAGREDRAAAENMAAVAGDVRFPADEPVGVPDTSQAVAGDSQAVAGFADTDAGSAGTAGAVAGDGANRADDAGIPMDLTGTARGASTSFMEPTGSVDHGRDGVHHFDAADATFRLPLIPSGRPHTGPVAELLVAVDEEELAELRPALEVLASQSMLALERIALDEEVKRARSEEYFRILAHNTNDVILILTEGDSIRYASPSAARIFGLSMPVGTHLLDLVDPRDRERSRLLLHSVREGDLSTEYADWRIIRADGSLVEVEVSCRDLHDDPMVGGLVLTLRDVTERRRLEAELSHRALHDSLTGLANRVLFHDRTNRAVRRAQRAGTLAGVLFIDLDDFKLVNERLGHQRGDQLLIAVGRRLAEVVRDHDTAARLGGDEFAILVEDANHPGDIERVAERVLAALAGPLDIEGEMLSGNASVGVAISADARDAPDLLRQADLALYLAKSEGKHQWRRYETTLHTALLERLELRAALERAVIDEEFVLHYQPIVELDGGTPVGFEALVRWNHPERGVVAPGEFIDVAEESGLIVPIGSWVLRTALAAMAHWRAIDPDADLYISVNVSARQFRAPRFIDEVRRELDVAGLPAEDLVLEITETLLLRDDDQVWTDLATLRALGVRVAIDDFGTGYSSLSYLRQVPIDILKIDRSFVSSMAGSPQQAALVEGIVRLAHTLGLQVVAEGVENATERDLLLGMGCTLGQGYLYARPMAMEEASRLAARSPS